MEEDQYICVGICMSDPDSGYCLGCGRPPLGTPDVVVEVMAPTPAEQISADEDPDSPA
jgi:predicted Fe-S protein YdhL (DUF1289 family)